MDPPLRFIRQPVRQFFQDFEEGFFPFLPLVFIAITAVQKFHEFMGIFFQKRYFLPASYYIFQLLFQPENGRSDLFRPGGDEGNGIIRYFPVPVMDCFAEDFRIIHHFLGNGCHKEPAFQPVIPYEIHIPEGHDI